MASLPSQLLAPDQSPIHLNAFNSSFACLFSHHSRRSARRHASAAVGRHCRYAARPIITCSAGNGSDDHLRSMERLERRGVLLGGLAGLGLNGAAAMASPIAPPDLSKCHSATVVDDDDNPTASRKMECCPPFSPDAIDFKLPSFTKLKVRRPAHLVDADYVKKFEMAIKLMKNLPEDDPRNFYQQANVHCAYCNDAYDQVGVADAHSQQLHIQVHYSWHFFPWHRIYLYYYERILGKLVGDEYFALPFWNWDHPDGMQMPALYTNTKSTLYNPNRNPRHLPPTTLILDYSGTDPDNADPERQIRENLTIMHRTMITNGKTADLFMGDKFVTGTKPNPGAGSLELSPHNNMHIWCGNPANAFGEDMGNFYSSGRDVMFYGLHANVDRMWDIWNRTLGHSNFDDEEWLNAAFYFYDENKQLVKVKVSNFLDSEKLGYTYESRELPWRFTPPTRKTFKKADEIKQLAAKTAAEFPLTLSSTVSTVVKRPKKSRSDKEKVSEEEALVIRDIELDPSIFAKFDVYVNAVDTSELTPTAVEFAGSFSNVPHKKKAGARGIKAIGTNLRLGLSELLKELGAEDDDSIVVTLVPRKGEAKVKIGGIGIRYIKIR